MKTVIVHDDSDLRHLLSTRIQQWTKHRITVEQTGYATRFPGVWRQWIQSADLFILGLERQYEGGTRAEGIMVARTLVQSGCRVLLVGVGCEPALNDLVCYWDLCSRRAFLESVDQCLKDKPPIQADIARLREHFESVLTIPTGH